MAGILFISPINEPSISLLHTGFVNATLICGRVSAEGFMLSQLDMSSGICIAAYWVHFFPFRCIHRAELFPLLGKVKVFSFPVLRADLRDSCTLAGF